MLRPAIAVLVALGLALSVAPANAERRGAKRGDTAAPLKMEMVPRLTADAVRKVQRLLQAKGFDPGELDGLPGRQTKDAVRKFQERYGIEARGVIDNQTLFALGAADLAGEGER
jgi:peptidoglycan hydrolase-like protein with peptidoglycan-binding domain